LTGVRVCVFGCLHSNSFVIGTAVINTHTVVDGAGFR
jgi:hypothetical protein